MRNNLIDVLLIEDDAGDVELTRSAVHDGKIGFDLHVVEDGFQAMDFLLKKGAYSKTVHPELIILNLGLPRKSGHEVLGGIKADVKLQEIPLVIFSTSIIQPELLKTYGISEQCFVTKPFRFHDLIDAMKSIERWCLKTIRRR